MGKKKRHTVKTQAVTDQTGEIQDIDPDYRGPEADKGLSEQSDVEAVYPKAEKKADLARASIFHSAL